MVYIVKADLSKWLRIPFMFRQSSVPTLSETSVVSVTSGRYQILTRTGRLQVTGLGTFRAVLGTSSDQVILNPDHV